MSTTALRLLCSTATLLAIAPLPSQGLWVGPDEPGPIQQPAPPQPGRPNRPPVRIDRRPLVELKTLSIEADIRDGVATTSLRQVFYNRGGRIAEGTWIFPLPDGATADRFTMTIGGQEVAGEVLDAGRARSIYEDIVRRQRDPGLLEYLGRGCLRARIFPIPPQGEAVVKVRFSQVLPEAGGFYEWNYPLRAAGVNGFGAGRLNLDVKIHSSKPIKNVYSPMAGLDISRDGDHRARASLELDRGQIASRDLSLHYGLSEKDFGLNLLNYRKAGQPGFFLMMLSPKRDWPEPKNTYRVINFVLDTSGSMSGDKIEQARSALRTFLGSLRQKEWFNVVPFSTEARPFFSEPVQASKENIEVALARVADLQARGGTNIEEALLFAMGRAEPDCYKGKGDGGFTPTLIPITVFLTDGLPTIGTTDVDQLLAQVDKANTHKARVFVFGVGNDVNTRLLDTVAENSRGARDYVRPGENIEVKTEALFAKLSGPVMTDVELSCDGIDGFDVYPRRTPDLFLSSTLVFVGRYRGEGHHAIRLKGNVDGTVREYVFEGSFPKATKDNDFLSTLWAQRKIAVLMDAIRLNGQKPELLEEVRRLGKEYGIVTPYTSHLILEEGMQVARFRGVEPQGEWFFDADDLIRVRRELNRGGIAIEELERERLVQLGTTVAAEKAQSAAKARSKDELGAAAVDKSVNLLALRLGDRMLETKGNAAGMTYKRIAGHNFYLVAGVWVDQRFRPEMRDRVVKVPAFGDRYFELLRERPDLAPFFAFSTRLVLVDGDRVLEIL